MPRLILLIFSIFLLALTEHSFSQESNNKIKFHPPETEAEKALDNVLTGKAFIDDTNYKKKNHINRNLEEFVEKFHTKEFMIEFYKLKEHYSKCVSEYPVECFPYDGLYLYCKFTYNNQDNVGYLYFSEKKKDYIIIYIQSEDKYKQLVQWKAKKIKNLIDKYGHQGKYIMKKENGKWKIDKIYCPEG